MDDATVYASRNRSVSRTINEDLWRAAGDGENGHVRMMCECGGLSCDALITMTPEEFASVRDMPNRYAVASEHVDPAMRIVQRNDRFSVIAIEPD